MTRRPSSLELIVGAPGLVVAALIVLLLAARALGVPPAQSGRTVTLAEAAALEDEADIVRLTREGVDPNAPGFVRRTRIRRVGRMMTPLEAAVTARHVSVMQLLVASGASIDDRNFPVLWCFADERQNRDVMAFLRAQRPNQPAIACSTIRTPGDEPHSPAAAGPLSPR